MMGRKLILTALFPVLLASCAALKPGDAPVTMRLAPTFAAASGALDPQAVAVAPVMARGVAGGKRYAYITASAPAEIHQAATLFWEIAPADALQRALIAGLRTRFATVTGPDVVLPAASRVSVTLNRFEEVAAGGDSRAVVAFDAVVVSAGKIARTASYCGTAPIGDASTTTRAHAFEQAITAGVGDLVQDMAGTGRSSPAAC